MRKSIITGLGLAAAALLLTACGGGRRAEAAQEERLPGVRVERVVMQDIPETAEFTSNIEAYKSNNIAPSMPLRIDKILVEVGQSVSRGQLLVQMDPTNYNQLAVQLTNLETDYARLQKVYDAGGISKQVLDQTGTQLQVLRTQTGNLSSNVRLTSPIDGVVTARNYDAGDMYNGAVPVLTVMQIGTLKVTLGLNERFFPMVRTGMPAQIRADVIPDKVFTGKVSLIQPAIDPATRTFKVEISIPNPTKELRPGMFSRTTLDFGTKRGIMVRDITIQRQAGTNERFLFVAVDGKAERRVVTTGVQIGSSIEILSGVHGGDEVIVEGIAHLMQGTAIEVIE